MDSFERNSLVVIEELEKKCLDIRFTELKKKAWEKNIREIKNDLKIHRDEINTNKNISNLNYVFDRVHR